jgi:hypothetical protein
MLLRACLLGCLILVSAETGSTQAFHPDIPRAWNDEGVPHFETPLAQRDRSPRYLTSQEYYALKPLVIYRSYPMYAPGREPGGYIESLKQKEPEIIFDPSKRNAFGHGGQAETLDEWFDPARLRDDYVPKGFHVGPGPIPGHPFGLKLSADDRGALIAFLKTL